MPSFFVGVDPSLTGNAIVIIDNKGKVHDKKLVSTHKECYICPEQRVLDVFNEVKYIGNVLHLEAIYIEGLSYMSVSPTLFERCGLLYLIITYLFEKDIPYKIIPPTSLKKFATTNGHADKKMMMRVAKCRWDVDFGDDNLCDAYCLARMAMEEYSK